MPDKKQTKTDVVEAADDDTLEEFDEIVETQPMVTDNAKIFEAFNQTSWDDEDPDDTFCARLKAQLQATKHAEMKD